ncbi:MAG: SIR2 family protein [Bryobacterales bacterium]|nr:SIR2 family protein [Bryobacterales bacterium]
MADEQEWHPVFEEIAAQPYYKPKFALALLQALDADFEPQKQSLRIDPTDDCDAIADRTVANLPPPVMVLVRWELAPIDIGSELDQIVEACGRNNCASVLILMPLALDKSTSPTSGRKEGNERALPVTVYGYADILELVKRNVSIVTRYVPHLTPLAVRERLKDLAKTSQDYWKHKRQAHLAQLRGAYSEDCLTLFLGAGVSIDAGLPQWRQLIDYLMIHFVESLYTDKLSLSSSDLTAIAAVLSAFRGDNPLISARYIRNALRDDFIPTLRLGLYDGFDASRVSPVINSIVGLCKHRRGHLGLQAIITYNFDDLIERALDASRVDYRTICSESEQRSDEVLNLFHVHGLLRSDTGKQPPSSLLELTFSEERYHHLYTQAYSWSNLQQLFYLKNSTCLLVGFSMTDPNLRRLLDVSAGRGMAPRHFAILKRTVLADAVKSLENRGNIAGEDLLTVLKAHHEIQELAFEELGVNVIWIEDYSELPTLLQMIRVPHAQAELPY